MQTCIVASVGAGRHTGGDHWSVEGELSIRGIARRVTLDVAIRGTMSDARRSAKAALTVSTPIQRSDFELTTELRQESGDPDSGPDVHITADIEAFLRV